MIVQGVTHICIEWKCTKIVINVFGASLNNVNLSGLMIMNEVNSTTLKNWAIIWSNIFRNNSPHVTHLTEDMKKIDHKSKDGFNLHICGVNYSL